MSAVTNLKTEIIRRLEAFSTAKLEHVLTYIQKLEVDKDRRQRVLKFAGSWKELDPETFDDLTVNLLENRKKDIRPIQND